MKKKIALLVSGLILIMLAGICFMVRDAESIYDNIYVSGTNISGKTKVEAFKALEEKKDSEIRLSYEGKDYNIPSDEVGYVINFEKTIDEAYSIGRSGTFLSNKVYILKRKFSGKKMEVPLYYSIKEEALSKKLEEIAKQVDIDEKDAKLSVVDGHFNITDEKNGRKLNIVKTEELVKENLKAGKHAQTELVVEVSVPKITREKLAKIDTLLGEYSTTFNSGVWGRSYNIKLSTDSINDSLLETGDVLSFNDSTGARSLKNGYKNAPVIVNGEVEEGMGGGVCQVSSTLFNAASLSGLSIAERSNHSIPSSYVDIGRDAVVDYGNLDLKIENKFKNPVYISSGVEGNKIIVKVYGNSSDKTDIRLYSVVNGRVGRKTKVVKSGKPSNGRDGIKATTYRVIKDKNGNETKEVLTSSYYPAKARVVVVTSNPESNTEM